MAMNYETFLKEQEQIEQLPDAEQKAYYLRWLDVHKEKTAARVSATLGYARVLYREGKFRLVMEALMPIVMNHHAYPYCEDIITCFNQMGLAVNCESEYTVARHFFQLALQLAEAHGLSSVYAKQHNNIGLTYYDQNMLEEADREYRLGAKWLPESSLKEIIGPMVYGNWTNVYLRQHRWKEALEVYEKGLSYQTDDSDDTDNQVLAMILYYKLGDQEKYLEAKRKFRIMVKNQNNDMSSFYYWHLLDYQIDPEDKELAEDGYRAMRALLQEPHSNTNWKGRTNYADMLYEKAEREGDSAGMMEALTLKNRVLLEAMTGSDKKRLDALNEYIDISAEKQKVLERAEEATRAKSQFLSSMSHDIRTPMNAIYGLAQLMEHDKQNKEKMDDHVKKLKASSKHLLSLINDVLDMSKIEASEVALNRECINLADQVTQLRSIVCPQTDDRRQSFRVCLHGIRHENLLGDSVRLRQILINLLSNAIKYTPEGGKIALDITEKAGESQYCPAYEFAVTDTGCGMSKEFMEHVFEAFTRAESSLTNKVQGTGLGMAITKNIVDMMGGTISVTSELGKGSCFTVVLPLEIDEDTEINIPFEHILMVAQSHVLIENMVTAFHGIEQQLQVEESVEDAEAHLAEHQTDVILLAGKYNEVQLAAVTSRLKKAAASAELVFCVDYDQKELTHEVLESCGIRKSISRPIFLTELVALFNQLAKNTDTPARSIDTILHGMKFLCAEDNTLNAEILEAILEMEGASCTILPDGKQIVDKFETVKPGDYDAILMDMQMPVMNGLDATKAIRKSANPLGQTIPIIAMTANAFSSDVQDCLNAGMDAHMSKPLDIKVLKQTINSIFGRNSTGGGGTVVRRKRTQLKPAQPTWIDKKQM